jgi:hypothetical protein
VPSALKVIVEQSNTQYMPLDIEHDPRIPPQGRDLPARMVSLPDSVPAVEGALQIFKKREFSDEIVACPKKRLVRTKAARSIMLLVSLSGDGVAFFTRM